MPAEATPRATHPGTSIATIEGSKPGPGGGKLIFENDRVKIWDIGLGPGQKTALHTHLLDYVLVQIEGDEICIELK
jgi:predicted metal-dependent enzyme (double-stranded beta helix superfamily)